MNYPNKFNPDKQIRKESGGDSVYYPLPDRILRNIFDPHLTDKIVGRIAAGKENVGSWNKQHGIFVHNKSGILLAILAQQNSIIAITRFLTNADDAWTIARNYSDNTEEMERRLDLLANVIGENITMCHLYEYKIGDLAFIIEKHFSDNPSYFFVQDKADNYSGTASVYSVSTERSSIDIPESHPSLIQKDRLTGRLSSDGLMSSPKETLAAAFGKASPDLVPNIAPNKASELAEPIENHLVYSEQRTQFLRPGRRQVPVLEVSGNSVINTAETIGRGTHDEFTYTGYTTNIGPSRPSSSFFPHPYWLGSIFGLPISIVKNPKTSAALIALALLTSNRKQSKYIDTYRQVNKVIDNEQVDKDLFKR